MTKPFDVAIIGSGFAGSILAWILAKHGRHVALIDGASHPRFAIGESSTPLADMLLRRLGEKHGVDEFVQLSTYGQWQTHHPEIVCGKKRGFSYYKHYPEQAFCDTPDHRNSLLVAASASDSLSDTHWLRSETDQFFFNRAIDHGVVPVVGQLVQSIALGDVIRTQLSESSVVESKYLIDASGPANVVARLLNRTDRTPTLNCRTRCVYGHFQGVEPWSKSIHGECDPFCGDDAAQHHMIGDGWMWFLRFGNGLTSVGRVYSDTKAKPLIPDEYPSLVKLFHRATIVSPQDGPRQSKRIQRFFHPVIDRNCWMLPTAAVTIDPLHSTGIAHAMAGIDRSVDLLLDGVPLAKLSRYQHVLIEEAKHLDRLVASAYHTMDDFQQFTAACMVYFAGAICCEERFQVGDQPSHLWSSDDPAFVVLVQRFLKASSTGDLDVYRLRNELQPWNTAGLLDASAQNRYAYTATKT